LDEDLQPELVDDNQQNDEGDDKQERNVHHTNPVWY